MNIVWLRRDLRLHDHAALAAALAQPGNVQPVFVFDSEVLSRFSNPHDRRLGFLARCLCAIDSELKKRGGRLLILQGKATEVMPKLAHALSASVFAERDFEPGTQARDALVAKTTNITLVKDHLTFAPDEIVKDDGTPFKVFTPYSKRWLAQFTPNDMAEYVVHDAGRYADFASVVAAVEGAGLQRVTLEAGAASMLAQIGYQYAEDALWPVAGIQAMLADFITYKVANYKNTRDLLAIEGTSRISPYLRFGLVSIREALRLATAHGGAEKYISELIWREFYAMIFYHYPESATMEWNPNYRKLEWSHNAEHVARWKEGKTGYPVVDAAMRQLLRDGWMHNRARMIVASFFTKDLQLDWRIGEEHFAQYLMDYEMSSNVGGWQWSASTGTDAQPWFRIFNPYLQSKKFDAGGDYIRKYVPELAHITGDEIHEPSPLLRGSYSAPMVDHADAREKTLTMFKAATGQTTPVAPD